LNLYSIYSLIKFKIMYFKTLFLSAFLSFLSLGLFAQTPSAYITIESNDQGFLPPRMTTVNRDNIAVPADGMIIFNTSTGYINYYDVFMGWLPLEPPAAPAPTVAATQTLNIGANAFKATRSSDVASSGYGQGGAYIDSPAFARMTAPIHLPVGTVINSVTFYYKDNSATGEINFSLDRENLTSGIFSSIVDFDTGTTTASDTWESSTTFTPNHTLIAGWGYHIDAFSIGWDGDMAVKGVSINYTLPTN